MALNSFRIIETIHHSRRFLLYKAESLKDSRKVLIKTQDPAQLRDSILGDSLIQETEVALELEHAAIRRSIAHFSEGLSVYMVAEYAPGITLAEYLLQNPDADTLDQCMTWAKDILHALHYAQERGIQHLNLNPYNIIIDEAARLKIIGFGKSSRDPWKHSEGNFSYAFPMLYVAPEIFKTSMPHQNSDLYSWAVILYQMLCKSLPWRLDSFIGPDEQKRQSFNRGVQMPDASLVPDWLYSILLSCLKQDPTQRIQDIPTLLSTLQDEAPDFEWQYQEPELLPSEPLLPDQGTPEPEAEITEPKEENLPEDESEPLVPSEEADKQKQTEKAEVEVEDHTELETEAEAPEEESALPEDTSEPALPPDSIDELKAEKADQQAPKDAPEVEKDEESSESKPEEDVPDTASLPESEIEESKPDSDYEDAEPKLASKEEIQQPEKSAPKKKADDKLPKPEHKAKPDAPQSDPSKSKISPSEESTAEPKDLRTMKKIFVFLMILSIIFVGYIFVDHYFINVKPQLELSLEEPIIDFEELSEPVLSQNTPIEMIWVPADTLIMGSISPEAGNDEFPLLTIPLRGFMISPTEITQAQWNMVSSSNPSLFVGDDLPVENVSFYDAVEFCNAKSIKDGLTPAYEYRGTEIVCNFDANGYRLPTEAEWEFAAKAGIGKSFVTYSGSDEPDQVGWYSANSDNQSHAVAKLQANALGIHDMSGNVYEWVWNWYAPYSYRVGNLFSGPRNGTDKVIRGGSWYHNESLMRNTARNHAKPFAKNGYTGFRVVRSR